MNLSLRQSAVARGPRAFNYPYSQRNNEQSFVCSALRILILIRIPKKLLFVHLFLGGGASCSQSPAAIRFAATAIPKNNESGFFLHRPPLYYGEGTPDEYLGNVLFRLAFFRS